ncbi:MAG: hypothetical protein R6V47_07840 [Candidatus Delongbacteria bacterium]
MVKIFFAATVMWLTLFGCAESGRDSKGISSGQDEKYTTIIANGYGASREKAVEDAKNDALRQFGFDIMDINGKPELKYAGKITDYKIIKDYSEELQKGMWYEIKIQARIERN